MIYDYYNEILGVAANAIFDNERAIPNSIRVIGDRGLRHKIKNGQITKLRNPGPNSPSLIKFEDLPAEWRLKLIRNFGEPEKRVIQSNFEKYYTQDSDALAFYTTEELVDGKYLPDEAVLEYTTNASVLNTVEKVYKAHYNMRKSLKGKVNDVWAITTAECNRFKEKVPHTLPENADRLRLKVAEYKKEGYKCLIHKSYGTTSGARKVTDETVDLLNAMFANKVTKPTATEIARTYDGFLAGYVEVINNETGECYSPSAFKKLSTATITNYLAKWTNKAATHAIRSGNRQTLMGKFRPYHTLVQPKFASSIISIDDRQPPFEYAPGKRVWFYCAVDLGSEAIVNWVYGKDKQGIILEFYRQLVRNYTDWGFNLPAELECESSLNSSYKDTFLREGSMFQFVRIEANNARGKRIEAYWKQLRYGLEKKREGWIARPFALSEPNQISPVQLPLVPFDTIVEGCLRDIETWNNTEHSKIKGKTRWEVFCDTQNPDVKPTNWRSFLPSLGYKTETSCRTGIIRLNNAEFLLGHNGLIAYSDNLIRLMDQVEGRDIDVYWLDDNEGKVMKGIVYLRGDDRPICEAIAKPGYNRARIEQTPEDEANRLSMSKYVASVDGYINNKKRSIDRVTIIDNRPTTLNNKFQIAKPKSGTSEMQPDNGWYENEPLAQLPTDDDFLNDMHTSFKRNLNERF
jgi:hypothetical protein